MRALLMTTVLTALALPALATQPTADWPCVQVLQPHLSLGQVWSGPAPDPKAPPAPEIAAVADRIVERRMTLAEAEAEIAAFAGTHDAAGLTALMQAAFDRIDRHRSMLIAGISRYGHKQVALAAQVEQRRERMAQLEKADKPDFDAIDAEEAALDWDTRVFTERQQSLTYVCETPVILEQRLFALARAISAHLPQQ